MIPSAARRATRSVLLTGCSSGVGFESALQFRRHDWRVIATLRDVSAWRGPEPDDCLTVIELDVSKRESIEKAVETAVGWAGRLDCVINCAGIGLLSVFETTPMDLIRSLFETNIFGAMQVMQVAIPHFRAHGGGRFVNVSSGSAIMPDPLMAGYSATKQALEAFSESVAHELATQNISVKLVEPGLMKDTHFGKNTLKHSLSTLPPVAYAAYVTKVMARLVSRSSDGLATGSTTAEAVFRAATDTSSRLRFLVGADVEESARMRRETCEDQYEAFARRVHGA